MSIYHDAYTEGWKDAERAMSERVAAAKAEALREAADEIDFHLIDRGVCLSCESNALSEAEVWLRARADRIEGQR